MYSVSSYSSCDGPCIYGNSKWTFTFDQGDINAFGLDLGDLGTVGTPTTLSILTSEGDSESWVFSSFTNSFFGFVSSSLVSSVAITNSITRDTVFIDNVRWSSEVPVPAPLAL